jgi:hypothetical protein
VGRFKVRGLPSQGHDWLWGCSQAGLRFNPLGAFLTPATPRLYFYKIHQFH